MSASGHGRLSGLCRNRKEYPLVADLVAYGKDRFRVEHYPAGSTVVNQGERPDKLFVVEKGAIELTVSSNSHCVTVEVVDRCGVFGDAPLFARSLIPFKATAVEDSRLLTLSSHDLLVLLQQEPILVQRLISSLAERVLNLDERLVEVLAGGIEQRVAMYLLHHPIVVISQARLARHLGVHRSSVNRVLGEFELAGLVSVGYRRVEVLDHQGLLDVLSDEPAGGLLDPAVAPARWKAS